MLFYCHCRNCEGSQSCDCDTLVISVTHVRWASLMYELVCANHCNCLCILCFNSLQNVVNLIMRFLSGGLGKTHSPMIWTSFKSWKQQDMDFEHQEFYGLKWYVIKLFWFYSCVSSLCFSSTKGRYEFHQTLTFPVNRCRGGVGAG